MTHGDDDGLRVPPRIAPHQIVILPMLREDEGDDAILAYCEELRRELAAQSAFGEPVRVLLDKRAGKATGKRWGWVKKGVPLILEIGGRDAAGGQVSVIRRDRLWNDAAKVNFAAMERDAFVSAAISELKDVQHALHTEAAARRDAAIVRGIESFDALAAMFSDDARYQGWAEVQWSKPTGTALDDVVARLKALKLTIRNTPMGGEPASGVCIFTGEPAAERIYVARAY
jgi:prolyl-tRNA synthetase